MQETACGGNRPTTGNNCDILKAVCNKLVRSINLDTPCHAFASGCRRPPVGAWLGVSAKSGDTPFRVRKDSCYGIALQGF